MRLIHVTNPAILRVVFPFFLMYLGKIVSSSEEQEMMNLVGAFEKDSPLKLYVLTDGERVGGYCLLSWDTPSESFFVLQCGVDDVKAFVKALDGLLRDLDVKCIYFITERNVVAWNRLVGANPEGILMKYRRSDNG